MADWYVLVTRPNKELAAEAALDAAGFFPLYPRIEIMRAHSESLQKVILPMFPRYLFIYDEPDEISAQLTLWQQRSISTGIIGLLSSAGIPTPVESSFVDFLRLSLNIYDILPLPTLTEKKNPFKQNDVVSYNLNHFTNIICIIHTLDGPSRVSLLWKVLGRDCIIPNVDVDLLSKEIV